MMMMMQLVHKYWGRQHGIQFAASPAADAASAGDCCIHCMSVQTYPPGIHMRAVSLLDSRMTDSRCSAGR
jgi:hypothetical protein